MLKNRLNSKISTGTLQICSITQQNDAEGVLSQKQCVCICCMPFLSPRASVILQRCPRCVLSQGEQPGRSN